MNTRIYHLILTAIIAITLVTLDFWVLKKLLTDPHDLIEITSTVTEQVKDSKGIVLGIDGEELNFIITENQAEAFAYLAARDVVGEKIQLLFDPATDIDGEEMGVNVFKLVIGQKDVLTYENVKEADWRLLYMLLFLQVLVGVGECINNKARGSRALFEVIKMYEKNNSSVF